MLLRERQNLHPCPPPIPTGFPLLLCVPHTVLSVPPMFPIYPATGPLHGMLCSLSAEVIPNHNLFPQEAFTDLPEQIRPP